MLLVRGQIVKSLAGHDKGNYFAVIKAEKGLLTLCDGKQRCLENPKIKKEKHTAPTAELLPEECLETNRKIRTALREFSQCGSQKG